MAEYIEREAVANSLNGLLLKENENTEEFVNAYNSGVLYAKERILEYPFSDVQPVRRGKWLEIAGYGGWSETYYQCPECNTTEYIPSNYCPNCGAELRGVENG